MKIVYTLVSILAGCLVLYPVILAIINSYTDKNPYWHKFGYAHFLGILLFIVALISVKKSKMLSEIGRSTYSIYLFHAIVFSFVLKTVQSIGLPPIRAEIYIVLVTVLTIILANITYRLIETPSTKLAKLIITRLNNKASSRGVIN
jgi:peptidoglycan/LPS O-acetylase OafA/YrhL